VRFDILVTVVVIVLLSLVLLDRLGETQRNIERMVVDSEVAGLRTELQLAVASRMVRGEEGDLRGWVGRNPLELVSGEPRSEKLPVAVDGFILGSAWHWRAEAGVLVYEYKNGERQQLRLAKTRPGQPEGWSLGGGLILVSDYVEKKN
jgi:hypothetical protein